MKKYINQTGISLIEVLVSVVIISIILSYISSLIVSSYKGSKIISDRFTAVQVAEALLNVYRNEDFTTITSTENINIEETLGETNPDLRNFSAKLDVYPGKYPSIKRIVVTVTSTINGPRNTATLEGYIQDEVQ